MTSELTRLGTYDELGAHRHLLISERLRLRRIGVVTTNKALSSLEHGAGLDVCKLPEIARALDCSLTYLVGLTDDPKRWEPDGTEWPTDPGAAPIRQRTVLPEVPPILGPLV